MSGHIDKCLDTGNLKMLAEHLLAEKDVCLPQPPVLCHDELTITCRKQNLTELLKFLRDDQHCRFRMLIDLTAVDWPQREERFDVVYMLLSLAGNLRVRVKVSLKEGDTMPTASEIFPNANWHEREVYDMFGIRFEGHPDLRRILCDYDFDGWPLRKDFPVEGKVELYYDKKENRVAQKPLDAPQEFRHFDAVSPWEGMDNPFSLAEEDNSFSMDEFSEETGEKSA